MLKVDKAFWAKLNKEFGNTLQRQLINEAGNRALRFSKQRFRQKNWVDSFPKPWAKRKGRKRSGRIMVQSGRLKRSIRITNKTATSITIGTDVPYARIHNEGTEDKPIRKTITIKAHYRKRRTRSGRSQVREHSRKMNMLIPQRQFLGESKALVTKIEKKMDLLIKKKLSKL